MFCAIFSILACAPVMAQEVAPSTRTARHQKEESPLMLNIEKDRYDSRVGLDYSIRWDFSDLKNIRPNIKTLAEGIAAVRNWDITENTRVKYYGFSTNPWRIIIEKEKAGGPAAQAGEPVAGGGGVHEYKKRLRLSFSPLVDDVKRDFDENLRNALLEASVGGRQWQKVSRQEKKIFLKDVLSLDIWGVPGLDETKKGIEYISK